MKFNSLQDLLKAQKVWKNTDGDDAGGASATPAATPKADPKPSDELTASQKANVQLQIDEAVKAAIATAQASWEASVKEAEDKERGEFEKLYNDLKPKHDNLEKQVAKLNKVVTAEIKAKVEKLPPSLKPLFDLVGDDQEAQLEFLQKASEVSGELGEPIETPPKSDKKKESELETEALAQRASTGLYS